MISTVYFHGVLFVTGFYEDGYAYFFTIQPANAENADEGFVSKLVRVCANGKINFNSLDCEGSIHSPIIVQVNHVPCVL